MQPTRIDDSEFLYRAVRADSDEFAYVGSDVRISASAFNDRSCKPSVDRSALRPNAADAKKSSDDRVVKLLTKEVRSIAGVRVTADKTDLREHEVDALHRPITEDPSNLAHSQIECSPDFINPSRFRKLKEALARLATKSGFVC